MSPTPRFRPLHIGFTAKNLLNGGTTGVRRPEEKQQEILRRLLSALLVERGLLSGGAKTSFQVREGHLVDSVPFVDYISANREKKGLAPQ